MKEKIMEIIIETLKNLNEELENDKLGNPTEKTELYSKNGTLDSLALVTLITDLEERISEEFNKNITLADERAMSLKNSPFRDVESLANYILKLLEE